MTDLTSQAIAAALAHEWNTAVTLNQKILQDFPSDCDALNRLAYAFGELGRLEEAQEIFERVLVLDPRNLIATKNLLKIMQMGSATPHETNGENHTSEANAGPVDPSLFLEEPGKTKTCHLIRIASKDIIANLRTGHRLHFVVKSRSIALFDEEESCVGYLPDDLSFSLNRFITGGNHYEAFIKSVAPSLVVIFIRELKRSSRYRDVPSFMDKKMYQHKQINLKDRANQKDPDEIGDIDAPEDEQESDQLE